MSLRRQALVGVLWNGLGNYLGFIISFIGQLVLVRLLIPEDFGIVALAVSILEVMAILTAWTFSIGIIQMPSQDGLMDTALWLVLGQCLVLLMAVSIVSLLLNWYYQEQTLLPWVFALLGAGRALTPLSSAYSAILEKDLNYKSLSILRSGTAAVATGTAVSMAVFGAGVWSLVGRELMVVLLCVIGFRYLAQVPFSWRFDPQLARKLLAIGRQSLLSRGLEAAYYKVDHLLIGSLAGVTSLGYYSQARYVVDLASASVAPATGGVLFPLYSKLQHDKDRLRRVYWMGNFFLVRLLLPMSMVLAFFPREIVIFVFGRQWEPTAPMLQWLSFCPLLVPMLENGKALLYGVGELAMTAWVRALQIVSVTLFILVGFKVFGLEGASIAVSVSVLIGLVAMQLSTARYTGGGTIHTFTKPVMAALVMGFVLFWSRAALEPSPSPAGVLYAILTAISLYLLVLLVSEYDAIMAHVRGFAVSEGPLSGSDRGGKQVV